MAEITREEARKNIRDTLRAFSRKVESARNSYDRIPLPGKYIVADYDDPRYSYGILAEEAAKEPSFIDEATSEELARLAEICGQLNKKYSLGARDIPEGVELKEIKGENAEEKLAEIKAILHLGCIFNEKEDYILNILNSMTTDDIRSIQEELYYLQRELYKKLNFSQGKKIREFYEANRCGLFATRDKSGNIIRLSYTPGNDLVFVNRKGELANREDYRRYKGGSRSEFFGKELGIGKNRADWMLQVAGYDYDEENKMNVPSEDPGRNVFRDFNIFGNELKTKISPEDKKDKIKAEVFRKFPELYARFGKRISGINGNIIELDEGKGKVLGNVPYFHQSDNETKDGTGDDRVNGNVMCQLTSLAMVLASKEIRAKDPSAQLEDELYKMAKEEGRGGKKLWDTVRETYEKVIPRINSSESIVGNGYEYDSEDGFLLEDEDFVNIEKQIDSSNPVIVDIKYGNNSGHVITCIGYTEKTLIVHDPYGNLEHGTNNSYVAKRDMNGAFVEYPKNKYKLGKNWIRYLVTKDNI